MSRVERGLPGAVVVLTAACTAPEPGPESELVRLSFDQLPAIESSLSRGPGSFGEVTDLELSEDGSVFVLDGPGGVVQVFDPDGLYERTIGGRGGGPGELERPAALFFGKPGELWVVDPGNGRYTVFDTVGEVVATYRRPGGGVFLPYPGNLGTDGSLYDVTFEFGTDGPTGFVVELDVADGAVAERRRLALPRVEFESFELEAPGLVIAVPVPFTSIPLVQADADGHVWYAETGEPWVFRRSFSDSTPRRLGREFDPPRVTDSALETALEHPDYEEVSREASPAIYRDFLDRVPDVQPHLRGFFLDDESRLWIMKAGPGAGTPVDVYERDGTLVATGTVSIASDPRPRLRNGMLIGVVRDDLGVESVGRFRLRAGN